ncbi:MAG TPA: maleylpyruvate isomerase N-terminal domain-containing protein [Kribbella sp.]
MHPADDLDRAVDSVIATLGPSIGQDWQTPAGSLEWTCRFTAEHAAHCLQAYAMQLASRAPEHYVSFFSRALEDATTTDVLELLEASGRLLSAAVRAAKPIDRGFHPFGMGDAEGFAGMGCIELLVHAGDIAAGLGLPFEPPPDVCAWILARMFPNRHAELESLGTADIDPWTTMQWATGRISIPRLPTIGSDWRWHSAPLADR